MEHAVSEILSQYAYSPLLVYGAVCAFMLMSAFGFPIPEEVILISAGFVGHMSLHPDAFPPPTPDAARVNVYVLAAVAFGAVVASDYLIYFLGKISGPKLFKMRWFARMVSDSSLEKIQNWTRKHGSWAVFIFRFTPGVRFPGHLICGAMGLSRWKFVAVDTLAAGISVPTQILLVSFYGDFILQYFFRFKVVFFSLLAAAFLSFIIFKIRESKAPRSVL
jgi:membrane protein DedA with SNARE-associated domain